MRFSASVGEHAHLKFAPRMAVILALGVSTPALAQAGQEANSGATEVQQADTGEIEDIVVTARRKTENLRDVPISVAAISGEVIAQRNIVQQEDLALYVPNFRQSNGSIGAFRFIRGAGSGSNLAFDQAVGSFFDGVYAGRGQLGRIPYFDIERVEVLRGPQVILFGNSTTAGAVNVTTRKPGQEFALDASASYEFQNQELILQGAATIPVAEGLSFRLAGFSQTLDKGYMLSITNGARLHDPRFDNQAFRITALIEPLDNLKFTLKYERDWIRVLGNTLQSISNPRNNPAIIESNFDRVRTVGQPAPFGLNGNNGIAQDIVNVNPETFLATVEYQGPTFTVTSNTAWLNMDYFQSTEGDLSPRAIFNFAQQERYRQFSQELRVVGKIGALADVQLGGYYQNDSIDASGFTDTNLAANGTPVPAFARRNDFLQNAKNWSVFADTTIYLSPKLKIGLGARYVETRKTADQIYRAANVGTWEFNPFAENLFIPPLGTTLFRFAFGSPHEFLGVKFKETHFMPQGLIQYDITDSTMIFAKVVKGAKAGGFDWLYSGDVPSEGIFKPEKALSYEAGLKGLFVDRTLSVDVTFYRTDFNNLQVSIFNGSTNFVVGNAAKSRSQGFELESNWRATPQLTLVASVAYLDSKYVSFPGAGCYYEQRIATPAGQICVQDLSGDETPYSSKWTGTAGVEYSQPIGNFTVSGRVDANFRSSYNPSLNNDPAVQQNGFTLIDARLSFGPTDGPWTISAFGKNLTDKFYTEQTSDTPLITGSRFATANRARQIGLRLETKF